MSYIKEQYTIYRKSNSEIKTARRYNSIFGKPDCQYHVNLSTDRGCDSNELSPANIMEFVLHRKSFNIFKIINIENQCVRSFSDLKSVFALKRKDGIPYEDMFFNACLAKLDVNNLHAMAKATTELLNKKEMEELSVEDVISKLAYVEMKLNTKNISEYAKQISCQNSKKTASSVLVDLIEHTEKKFLKNDSKDK